MSLGDLLQMFQVPSAVPYNDASIPIINKVWPKSSNNLRDAPSPLIMESGGQDLDWRALEWKLISQLSGQQPDLKAETDREAEGE